LSFFSLCLFFFSCDKAPEKGVYFGCAFTPSSETLGYGESVNVKVDVDGGPCILKDYVSDYPIYIDGKRAERGETVSAKSFVVTTDKLCYEDAMLFHFRLVFAKSLDSREVVFDKMFSVRKRDVFEPTSISLSTVRVTKGEKSLVIPVIVPANYTTALKWRVLTSAFSGISLSEASDKGKSVYFSYDGRYGEIRLKVMSAVDTSVYAIAPVYVRHDAVLTIGGNFSSSSFEDYRNQEDHPFIFKMTCDTSLYYKMTFKGELSHMGDASRTSYVLNEGSFNFNEGDEFDLVDSQGYIYNGCSYAANRGLGVLHFYVSELVYDKDKYHVTIDETYKKDYWWGSYDK
jgi:hypothetical protein